MRLSLVLCAALFACSTATPSAPDADPDESAKTLARRVSDLEAFAVRAVSEINLLKTENARLQSELDGHVTVLKAAGTDLSDGTCAMARDGSSGMATGRRQYKPIIIHTTTHPSGTPHAQGDPIHGVDVKLGLVDADADGDVDFLALEGDLDGDGLDELVELGGDFDGDGDFTDDAAEADKDLLESTNLVCGATDHF